jgi:hypothetical protein
MKKLVLIVNVLMLFQSVSTNAQMAGTEAYLKGNYVEIGISGAGGFEGADTTSGIPSGMHFRSGNPYFGFVANPQHNSWATYNGDYFSPGSPENGWGFEIRTSGGATGSNNCVQSGPFGSGQAIPGSITYSAYSDVVSAIWDGDITTGTNLHFKITTLLHQNDDFYTTIISVTNNTAAMIDTLFYYRNVDPDNNESIDFNFTTMNKIVSQPTGTAGWAWVSATQSPTAVAATAPWYTYLSLAAFGPNWRANMGGFTNRDASDIWSGSGASYFPSFDQTVGDSAEIDASISLAYRILNLNPGATETFQFYTMFDSINMSSIINHSQYLSYPGSLGTTVYTGVDTVVMCSGSSLPISVMGPAVSSYTWAWSPSAGLSTTTGANVIATPSVTTTYTVIGTPTSGAVTPDTMSIVVNVGAVVGVPVITPVGSICATAAPITLTADSTGGVWSGAGITNSALGTFDPAIAGQGPHTIAYTIMSGCGATGITTIMVDSAASVNITASNTLLCSVIPVTFTATPTNGGTTPSYQWQLNGVNVGMDSVNFTTSALANNDLITCVMTSSASVCGSPATSNAITIHVGTPTTGPTIAWSNCDSINYGTTTITTTGLYPLHTTNSTGCDSLFYLNATIITGCDVWPGDANHDSIDDNNDLLPIGIFYGQTGPARLVQDDVWTPHFATPWGILEVNGQDIKHADCNGDGVIDSNDSMSVYVNFAMTHAISAPSISNENRTSTPDLYFVTSSSSYNAGDWVDAELWAGTSSMPVPSLYGIAFNINFDASLVQSGTESITYPSCWLDSPGTNQLSLSKTDELAATSYGAVTRINHTNANGYGKIADFRFQVKSSLTTSATFNYSISHYSANDSSGAPELFNMTSSSLLFVQTGAGINTVNTSDDLKIYPNPTTGLFVLESSNSKIENVKVFNVLGECVYQSEIKNLKSEINMSQYSKGIYFVQITTDKGIINRKLVKN